MTRRVAFGRFPDGGFGLRASKPGYDVLTQNPDYSRLVFNSDWDSTLPVYCTSGLVSMGTGQTSVGFSTGALAFIPMFQGYCSANGGATWIAAFGYFKYRMSVDSGNFYFWNNSGLTLSFFAVAYNLPSGM